jgi:hypothetical protein
VDKIEGARSVRALFGHHALSAIEGGLHGSLARIGAMTDEPL